MRVLVSPQLDDVQTLRIAGEIINMETGICFYVAGKLLKTPQPEYNTYTLDGITYTTHNNSYTIMIDPRVKFRDDTHRRAFGVDLGEAVRLMYKKIEKYANMYSEVTEWKPETTHHYNVSYRRYRGDISTYAVLPNKAVGRYFRFESNRDDTFVEQCRFVWHIRYDTTVANVFNFRTSSNLPRADSVILVTCDDKYAVDNSIHLDYLRFPQCNAVTTANIYPQNVMFSALTGTVLPLAQHLASTGLHKLGYLSYGAFVGATVIKASAVPNVFWIDYNKINPHEYKSRTYAVKLKPSSKDVCAVTGLPLYDDIFTMEHSSQLGKHICLHPYVIYHTRFLAGFSPNSYILARSRSPKTLEEIIKHFKLAGEIVDLLRAITAGGKFDPVDGVTLPCITFGNYVFVSVPSDSISSVLSYTGEKKLVVC